MEQRKDARILIVDDESCFCKLLETMVSSWGMDVESTVDPHEAVKRIASAHFDILLLDISMPQMNDLDLIPEITRHHPDAKAIVLTEYTTKDVAIKALKRGAFDLLEKPFSADFLQYAIRRALDAQSAERKAKHLIEELELTQRDLVASKQRFQDLNKRLLETNKALSLLAQNIELERNEMEIRIATKLKSLIIPILNKIRHDSGLAKYRTDLDILLDQIGSITSGFSSDAQILATLSLSEVRIASLVKSGMTSNDIADQLNVSPATVRTHRKNIRKKLKINNPGFNLRRFLLCKQHPLTCVHED